MTIADPSHKACCNVAVIILTGLCQLLTLFVITIGITKALFILGKRSPQGLPTIQGHTPLALFLKEIIADKPLM